MVVKQQRDHSGGFLKSSPGGLRSRTARQERLIFHAAATHTHHRCSRAHMRELIRALEIRDLQARSHTMALTLAQAAKATGLNRSTILRAIKSGRISGTRDDMGAWTVEPVELHRIFPPAEAEPKAGAASRTA